MANEELTEIQKAAQEVIEEHAPLLEKLADLNENQLAMVEAGLEQARNGEFVDSPENDEETKELLAAIEDAEKPAEEDFLAAFYERHGRTLQALINQLGKNALKRIIIYTYMGEFAPKAYQPKNKIEADAAFQFNEGVFKRVLLRMEQEYKAIEEAELKEKQDLEEIEKLNQEAMTPEAKAEIERLELEAKNRGENNEPKQ